MASLLSFNAPSTSLASLRRRFALAPRRTPLGLGFPSPSTDFDADRRRSALVVRLGPSHYLPDFEAAGDLSRELVGRIEGLLYTVADAAASAEGVRESAGGDWLSGITSYLETVLKVLKDGLSTLHVPYSYGFAIILLTVLVKAATFPLTRKQVESVLTMKSLQPQMKAIQKRYAGDPERIQLETARLYKLAGVNPLAGCFPTVITIPVWIGLYRALSNVANEGLLSEGFFWIPSLAGPTSIAARQSGSGISWLFPFVDGHPPLGWSDTLAYLVLPFLLVISQYISAQMMQPSQNGDPSQKNAQAITKFLPLMIGYFSLSVPSGLSLYWLTNNILSSAQQIWLQKLGGARNPVQEYIDRTNRDESSNSEKNITEILKTFGDAGTTEVKPNQGENESSSKFAPGERFKQIKEQEARRKKEKEEKQQAQQEVSGHQMAKLNENEAEDLKNDVEFKFPTSNNGGFNNHELNGRVNFRGETGTILNEVYQENEAEEKQTSAFRQASHSYHDSRDKEAENGEA